MRCAGRAIRKREGDDPLWPFSLYLVKQAPITSLNVSLVYQPEPSAMSSSKARWNQPSFNKSTDNPGVVVMLNISTGRRGSFLKCRMSYLKFKVTNTGSDVNQTITANYDIASMFSKLELYHG